ncbi:MAG: lipopolysaccharide biosynthesis protein [Chloroflexi bacterium]|nr:lipopolysaccharide biosynthesis protein [Chloroflexota bacterium]
MTVEKQAPSLLFRARGLLRRDSFARDVSLLMTGAAASQVVVVASTPVITRLYTVEQVGFLGVLVAASMVLGPLVCARYEQAVVLPERDEDAASLVALSLTFTILVSIIAFATVALAGQRLLAPFGAEELIDLAWVVPIATLALGAGYALRQRATRARRFAALSVSRFLRASVMAVVQIGLALAVGVSMVAIALGFVAGLLAEAIALGRPGGLLRPSALHPAALWRVAVRYRRFPIFLTPGGLAVAVGFFGLPVFVGILFGPETAGYFFVAERVLSLPVSLVSQSIGAVLLQRLSVRVRNPDEDPARWIASISMGLLAAAALPAVVFAFAAPWLFEFAFGPGWWEAGLFAQAGALRAAVSFAAMPMTNAFVVYEKQGHLMAWQISVSAVQAGSLFAGAALGGPVFAVWVYSITSAVVMLTAFVLPLRFAGVPWREHPRTLALGLADALRVLRRAGVRDLISGGGA